MRSKRTPGCDPASCSHGRCVRGLHFKPRRHRFTFLQPTSHCSRTKAYRAPDAEMGYAASLHPPMNRDGCDVQEASKFGNTQGAAKTTDALRERQRYEFAVSCCCCCRHAAPWNGTVQQRGSTSVFPVRQSLKCTDSTLSGYRPDVAGRFRARPTPASASCLDLSMRHRVNASVAAGISSIVTPTTGYSQPRTSPKPAPSTALGPTNPSDVRRIALSCANPATESLAA
jgi:hypothetical protein